MKKVCNMDCFHCKYDDCINDYVRPMHVITTEKERISNRNTRKKRYDMLKQAGLCTDCGKNPAYNGGVRCYECRLKANKRGRQAYREKHPTPREIFRENSCFFCAKKCVEGKKVCKKHLEVCIKNAEKARESENFKTMLKEKKKLYFSRG